MTLDEARVAIGCASLMAFALGVLVGVWLCDRKMTKILKDGAGHNATTHEYKRKLADLKPGDRL